MATPLLYSEVQERVGVKRFNMPVIAALQYLVQESVFELLKVVELAAFFQLLQLILYQGGRLDIALRLGLIPITTLLARVQLPTLPTATFLLRL